MLSAQSPLMVAVRTESLTVISSLLNARMPKVDVNFVKSVNIISSYFYFWNFFACMYCIYMHVNE